MCGYSCVSTEECRQAGRGVLDLLFFTGPLACKLDTNRCTIASTLSNNGLTVKGAVAVAVAVVDAETEAVGAASMVLQPAMRSLHLFANCSQALRWVSEMRLFGVMFTYSETNRDAAAWMDS